MTGNWVALISPLALVCSFLLSWQGTSQSTLSHLGYFTSLQVNKTKDSVVGKKFSSSKWKNYCKRITKMKVMTVRREALTLIEAPFSIATQLAISDAFTDIQWMFVSISKIVSSTFMPAVLANEMKLSRWASVLIASANIDRVSLKGTLLQQKGRESFRWNSSWNEGKLTSRWLRQSFPRRISSLKLDERCSF